MEYRQLGYSGLKVPVITLGAGTFGGSTEFFKKWGSTQVDEAKQLVSVCLEAGANLFDVANAYSLGAAEEILGKAIAGRRNDVLISTKASIRMGEGPNNLGSSRFHVMEQVHASLKRLGTEHIDIYHMHIFDAITPIEETLETLDTLVKQGKIRYIAASNFSGWHLMKSLAISEKHHWQRYVAHQVYYSLMASDFIRCQPEKFDAAM
jgi:aryl-alcohol dehydrogenase-like predicted oxidoreductase